ncbi:C2H2-type zinc finger protein [Halobium palmae]|uniref:C2H2-type zinc finger protein n=1 Tax=Halobium palmae TaxID=1776492 RepID=A0ABD5S3E2_9EURY
MNDARDASERGGSSVDSVTRAPVDESGDGGTRADVDVPDGAKSHVCEHCGHPFPEERYRTLHAGLEHYDRLDDDEREAFGEAYEAEGAEIRRFRLLALAALLLLYFGFLFMYAAFA